jgi:general nucleoside transport system permease protein
VNVLALVAQTLRIAVPYLFAAAGGVLAECSGVVSLTLEGFMLTGAFTAMLGSYYGGSAWMGLACAAAGGVALGLVHAVACIRYRADQVVSGIAVNLLAVGATRFFLQLGFHSSSNSPRVAGFSSSGSLLGLFANPLVVLGLVAIPFAAFVLHRTRFGLRVQAAGEHPEAAASVGIAVGRVRGAAVVWSGVLAALGGAYLALDQHQFSDGMSAGRGFIALAAIIFGSWQPLKAGGACLLFAAAETLQMKLQGTSAIPSQFVQMIPYVLTIVALMGLVGRAVPPAALGKATE